jgi:cell division septum initiation protein DivIVA
MKVYEQLAEQLIKKNQDQEKRIAQLEEALEILYDVACSCNGHIYLKSKQLIEIRTLLSKKLNPY